MYDTSNSPEDAIDPAQFAIQRKGGLDLCVTIELSRKFLTLTPIFRYTSFLQLNYIHSLR